MRVPARPTKAGRPQGLALPGSCGRRRQRQLVGFCNVEGIVGVLPLRLARGGGAARPAGCDLQQQAHWRDAGQCTGARRRCSAAGSLWARPARQPNPSHAKITQPPLALQPARTAGPARPQAPGAAQAHANMSGAQHAARAAPTAAPAGPQEPPRIPARTHGCRQWLEVCGWGRDTCGGVEQGNGAGLAGRSHARQPPGASPAHRRPRTRPACAPRRRSPTTRYVSEKCPFQTTPTQNPQITASPPPPHPVRCLRRGADGGARNADADRV